MLLKGSKQKTLAKALVRTIDKLRKLLYYVAVDSANFFITCLLSIIDHEV